MNADAAVLTDVKQFSMQSLPVAQPRPGQVLIKVEECGLCGSDLKMYHGHHPVIRPPVVMGHELYGSVADLGDGDGTLVVGDPVVVVPSIGCGTCFNCQHGEWNICESMELVGGHRPGGLGGYVLVPRDNVVLVRPEVPAAVRVLVEPLAVAIHVVHRSQLHVDEQMLVIGCGPIGILTAYVLRDCGARHVHLTDLSSKRLSFAVDLDLGVALTPGTASLAETVRNTIRPEGLDLVFECAGSSSAALEGLRSTRKGGRVVLAGIQANPLTVDGVLLQRHERALIGVQMYTKRDFEDAMDLLARGLVPPGLVTHRFGLDQVAEAFEALEKGESAMKVVVRPSERAT